MAAILQRRQGRGELVQLGHAVGTRALAAHHRDEIALQRAGLEGGQQGVLGIEDARRGLDAAEFRRDCGNLDHRAAEVALQPAQAAFGIERRGGRAHDVGVARLRGRIAPAQGQILQIRLHRLPAQAAAVHAGDVLVQQPGVEQLGNDEADAAGGFELVYVGRAVGIDARQQRGGA